MIGPHFRVNNWVTSETTIKKWFQRMFVAKVTRKGFKVFCFLVSWL